MTFGHRKDSLVRKFYYELEVDEGIHTYCILEDGGGCEHKQYYDVAWCWVTDEQDAKDLVGLLHKLQGAKGSC